MSHADKTHDTLALSHDQTSKIPSKSSQPPIAMATGNLWDYDRRVFLAKKYRTQIASGPASFLSVLAGVRKDASQESIIWIGFLAANANLQQGTYGKHQDENAIVCPTSLTGCSTTLTLPGNTFPILSNAVGTHSEPKDCGDSGLVSCHDFIHGPLN